MKLAFITPTNWISTYGKEGDFILALAHLIEKEPNKYEKAIIESNIPIILDNGLFENHEAVGVLDLFDKAQRIGAHTVFVPDVLYKTKETATELDHAISVRENIKAHHIKLGAVPQADNVHDYQTQLLEFNNNKYVSLIGLSILAIPHSYREEFNGDITKSRIALLQWMIKKRDEGVVWKDCHLLGLGDSYEDVIFAKNNCPWVISNDTSCAFQSGLFYKELTDDLVVPGGKIKEKVNFDLIEINSEQEKIIVKNINKIKEKIYDSKS